MASSLIVILVVIAASHFAPDLLRLRRHEGFAAWAAFLGERVGASTWRHPAVLALTLGAPLLLILLLQALLHEPAHGVFGLLLAIAVLFLAWGPRDLDQDVDAAASAPLAEQPDVVARVFAAPAPVRGGDCAAAVGVASLRRWFGPLLWFVLLGAVGAALYRLAQLAAQAEEVALPPAQRSAAQRLLAVLDWPVVQLMALGMAIATDFDTVLRAWQVRTRAAGGAFRLDAALLPVVTAAAVKADLAAEGDEAADQAFEATAPAIDCAPVLRDARAVLWRVLVVWLTVLALVALAGL